MYVKILATRQHGNKMEKDIEAYLKRRVEAYGGACIKFVSPGMKGAPDRIVFLNERLFFVELKTLVGRLSKVQISYHKFLRRFGYTVAVLNSTEQINNFLDAIQPTRLPGTRY